MRLKLKINTTTKVCTLSDDATLLDLRMECNATELTSVRFGFPPKQIVLTDESKNLTELGIKSGESLIITTKQDNTSENEAAPTTTKNDSTSSSLQKAATKLNTNKIINNSELPYIKLPKGETSSDMFLVLRKIPDDNSCLFNSIGYSYFGAFSILEASSQMQLRSIVSDEIMSKPIEYNEAILGKPPKEYCDWIKDSDHWGGAIELQILSKYLNICIWTVDIETKNIYKFNEDADNFIIICYSGIHYDAISLTMSHNFDIVENDTNVFLKNSEESKIAVSSLMKLIDMLNLQGYYTNTAKFSMRCEQCNMIFKGEKDATKHAKSSGHYKFGEVKS
ncbi:unnamed protein product [[Candida] boidinii]|uniref:Unnamed protein product n=1 Tax=Candida boidinii TaxID=5477 RepID=A0ACB5TH63_CANBO|nr:unnamed protein product [[Candida] boidinii]